MAVDSERIVLGRIFAMKTVSCWIQRCLSISGVALSIA